ncbi:MAG TPA: hypothetical protein DDW52_12845 [Planctomycetaceae bacterium]|nr:hypothetical protein [Planctomycetaceae bacterium]
MRYQEYLPPSELAQWVKLFWVFESHSHQPAVEQVVADGFPELIIHYRAPFQKIQSGQLVDQPEAVVCGQLTRPLQLCSSPRAGMIGIRFQPSGMAACLPNSILMRTLTDAQIPAHELFEDIDPLIEAIQESLTDAQRVAACNRFLMRTICGDAEDFGVGKAVDRIMQAGGCISVESLADLSGKSLRSLELAFQRVIGTSPKMFCRIARFRYVYDSVSESAPSADWVRIALDAGFFDQSHLIRDFRRFSGESPTAFLAAQTPFTAAVN